MLIGSMLLMTIISCKIISKFSNKFWDFNFIIKCSKRQSLALTGEKTKRSLSFCTCELLNENSQDKRLEAVDVLKLLFSVLETIGH